MADYLFGSANLRALENAIIGSDRIKRILETQTLEDAYAALAEYGVRLVTDAENGSVRREETLLNLLRDAYGRVYELAPDSKALQLWLYPYDCNNLKAAIKCAARGIDPDSMYFDFGSVPAERFTEAVRAGQFDFLPTSMQKAASEAIESFTKTRNPQVVDLILDRACYADMLCAAQTAENDYVLRLVRAKIDLTNLNIAIRILRMNSGEAGKALLRDALLFGGEIDVEKLVSLFEKGENTLLSELRFTAYAPIAEQMLYGDATLTVLERACDDFWMEMVKETKFIPMGLEVMVSFLLAHEYEVRNLRIVLSGKEAGLSVSTIRERIRASYV